MENQASKTEFQPGTFNLKKAGKASNRENRFNLRLTAQELTQLEELRHLLSIGKEKRLTLTETVTEAILQVHGKRVKAPGSAAELERYRIENGIEPQILVPTPLELAIEAEKQSNDVKEEKQKAPKKKKEKTVIGNSANAKKAPSGGSTKGSNVLNKAPKDELL